MKQLIIFILFSLVFLACKKSIADKPINTNQSSDTNKWVSVWQNDQYELMYISLKNKDTGYVVAFQDSTLTQSILITHNGGKTWIYRNINIPIDSASINNLCVSDNNTLFFASPYYIYKSTDEGIHWKIIFSAWYIDLYYNTFLMIDNQSLLVYDQNGIHITKDEGNTWDNLIFYNYSGCSFIPN